MAIFRGTGGSGDSTQDSSLNEVTQQAINAANSATAAATSASSSAGSASAAATSETNAAASEAGVAASASASASSAANSLTSANNSEASKVTSATKASEAATSATNAGTSETNAATSATASASSAANALSSQNASSGSETNASSSATAAATSASTATTQASTATTKAAEALASQTASAASETSAATSAATATTQASTATTKASEASASATAAASSESTAATSETNAATSATTATTQATTATTKASEASTSETNAATSATTATTQATSASSSATSATTSAATATTKASEAVTSATSAATSLATFTGQYVSQTTAPSSPDTGDLWFDTSTSIMKVYNGASWANAGSSVNGIENSVQYIATAGQTTFSSTYDAGYVDVYLNGILLATTDYTATNGSSVVLNTGASVSDVVYIQAFGTFALADHYTKVASDARYAQETYVDTAISNLVDSSPAALDTLNELASALGDDPNFATTVNANIATKLPKAGGTMTGDTLHGDNVKAKFGTGGDLEIYHDGGTSYIKSISNTLIIESTTGDVQIRPKTGEKALECNDDGSVKVYYDGSPKLATNSTGIDVTGTVTADGLQVGDNQWIYAGNGADLKIGHDGTDSTIRSQGSPLYIDANGITFRGYSPYTKHMDIASNGDISFYEDTGTTAKFFWDASAESLGIGTSSPSSALDVTGTVTADGANITGQTDIESGASLGSGLNVNRTSHPSYGVIGGGTDTVYHSIKPVGGSHKTYMKVSDGNDVSFMDDTGAAPKFFWDASAESLQLTGTGGLSIAEGSNLSLDGGGDTYIDSPAANEIRVVTGGVARVRVDSSGNVGIGTSSPVGALDVRKDGTSQQLQIWRSDLGVNDRNLNLTSPASDSPTEPFNFQTGNAIAFRIDATEALRIDSNANVGIGTSSPTTMLDVRGADDSAVNAKVNGSLQVWDKNTVSRGTAFLSIDSSSSMVGGNLRLDSSVTTGTHAGYAKGTNYRASSAVAFELPSSDGTYGSTSFLASSDTGDDTWGVVERMRIDSSGNVLVGKTSLALSVEGITFEKGGAAEFTTDASRVMRLNRTTDDGSILELNKDGTTVGSIGSYNDGASAPYFADAGNVGIRLSQASTDDIRPCSTTGADRDAAINLGGSSARFKDLYLSGGVYLGGTGAANKLDDYEEGTWTPALTHAGSNVATGTIVSAVYTKVGSLVYLALRFTALNMSTHSDTYTVFLSGLPFTPASGGSEQYQITTGGNNIDVEGGYIDGNAIRLIKTIKTNASLSWNSISRTNGDLRMSVTYKTNA